MIISFLMAAHNEEKIIRKPLENFRKIHSFDKNIEFIIGLDGCIDRTEDIIKEYPFVKYYKFKGRNGKPVIINNLMKKAKGEIIIIHDADWIFNVKNKSKWIELKNEFKDKRLGGIAESYPIEYIPEKLNKIKSIGHLGSLWGNYFWMDFQKKYYTYKKDNKTYAKFSTNNFPFLTNIFRKELYNKNITLGDDFERTIDILNKRYNILIKEDKDFPRMIAAYDKTRLKDITKQKQRTAIAREQVFKKYSIKITFTNFYIPLLLHSLKNINKIKWLKGKIAFIIWLKIFILGTIINKLSTKKKSTKEGWLMRSQR
jgi:hypothetical protein